MQRHLIAHRQFSRRLRTLTASASSGACLCVVSSVPRAQTADVLALHRPLLRPPFSRLATTVQSRRLRLLSEPRSEQRRERQVSLGFAPEGAVFLRPFARRRACKVRRVAQGREKTSPLFSFAGASSLDSGASSSTPCSAGSHPPWPNTTVEGTACKLRLQVPRRLRRRAAPHLRR